MILCVCVAAETDDLITNGNKISITEINTNETSNAELTVCTLLKYQRNTQIRKRKEQRKRSESRKEKKNTKISTKKKLIS